MRLVGLTFLSWLAAARLFEAADDPVRSELRAGVDEMFSGDPAAAERRFERVARDWPGRAEGPLFASYSIWSAIEDDPLNPELRRRFSAGLERAQVLAAPSCAGSRSDADSCLSLGLVSALRARLYVLDGERLKAASEARQGKRILERVLTLAPEEHNALFGLGAYDYYAAQIPRVLRILGFMLWLPGGNKERGLAELEQARASADLLGPEAHLQLHDIYKFYEKDYSKALECLDDLIRTFPGNARLYRLKVYLEGHFMGRPDAALATCQLIIHRGSKGAGSFSVRDECWARYLDATVLFRRGEREEAMRRLTALAKADPPADAALYAPSVHVTLALYSELSGKPDRQLYHKAARSVERRELLLYLETRLRSVLPPEGYKSLRRFTESFDKFLRS